MRREEEDEEEEQEEEEDEEVMEERSVKSPVGKIKNAHRRRPSIGTRGESRSSK